MYTPSTMVGRWTLLRLAFFNLLLTGVDAVQVRNEVNSVSRVVNLLQDMAKKITVDGKQVHNF